MSTNWHGLTGIWCTVYMGTQIQQLLEPSLPARITSQKKCFNCLQVPILTLQIQSNRYEVLSNNIKLSHKQCSQDTPSKDNHHVRNNFIEAFSTSILQNSHYKE